jgi:hypothetical protein
VPNPTAPGAPGSTSAEVVEEVIAELVGASVSFAVGGEVPGEGQVRRAVGEGTDQRGQANRITGG